MSIQIGDTIGDYQIIDLLGAGGMGKVYKVRNVISDRVDALKVLLPSLADNQDLADRFIREIKVLASLNHPNIAALRTAFRIDNQLLMLMEFVEGRSLDKDAKAGPFPIPDAVHYIRQVLAALSYAHERGVIHRDIKPANMMLTPDKVIKLMDFGIAKSTTDQKLTQTGLIMGSLSYMSPEQVRGSGVDSRSDLYSVGVSLYEFVTGVRPFQGGTDFDLMMAQLQNTPVPPIERLPALPGALSQVIMSSLEKEPEKRFQTAEEFSNALRESTSPDGVAFAHGAPTAVLTASSILPETRISTTVQTQPPNSSGSAAPAPPVASAAATAPPVTSEPSPALPVAKPSPRPGFLLPVGIGAAVIVLLALGFFLYHSGKPGITSLAPPVPVRLVSFPSGAMVLVDGGDALLGPKLQRTAVGPFYIDKTEVPNGVYLDFCRATGHTPPPGIGQTATDTPVVNVTYDDARSFCGWASTPGWGGKRLPTANEWEKAARGSSGQPFPWGSVFDSSRANVPRDDAAAQTAKLAPVTDFESGKSPYGALNMLGNAWEWVDAKAQAPAGDEFRAYQQTFRDLVPPLSPTEAFYYARGGSFSFPDSNPAELISDPGSPLPARARKPDVGFRCAMDAKN